MAELKTDHDYLRGSALASRASTDRSPLRIGHRTGMLLLHPLCLHTGHVDRVLPWLESNGFRVVFTTGTQLTGETVRRLWKFQRHGQDPMRVRLFTRMLTWDAALVIGVTASPPANRSTASHLAGLKGPADPRKLDAGHLRHTLGSANLLNNLVHTSDGPREVMRESAILLGETLAATFWTAAARERALPGDGGASIPRGHRLFDDGRGISPAHVLAPVRRSIADRLGSLACQVCGTAELRAIEASIDGDDRWLRGHDSRSPVATLGRYRDVASPWLARATALTTRCPHTSVEEKAGAPLRLLELVESGLFGTPDASGDLDVEAICDESAADLDERQRITLLSGYLSSRLGV